MKILAGTTLAVTFFSQSVFSSEDIGIFGEWICGPYTLESTHSNIESTDTYIFLENGKYLEKIDATYTSKQNGSSLNLVTRLKGSWAVEDGTLVIEASEIEFVSSSNPLYTKEIGQQRAEESLEKIDSSKYIIAEVTNTTLLLNKVDALNESLDNFTYECTKA